MLLFYDARPGRVQRHWGAAVPQNAHAGIEALCIVHCSGAGRERRPTDAGLSAAGHHAAVSGRPAGQRNREHYQYTRARGPTGRGHPAYASQFRVSETLSQKPVNAKLVADVKMAVPNATMPCQCQCQMPMPHVGLKQDQRPPNHAHRSRPRLSADTGTPILRPAV